MVENTVDPPPPLRDVYGDLTALSGLPPAADACAAEREPVKLRNGTDLVFVDISSEAQRTYRFPPPHESVSHTVVIVDPLWLHVSRSGGHRILDAEGMSHYIPKGWLCLSWVAKPGAPHFTK